MFRGHMRRATVFMTVCLVMNGVAVRCRAVDTNELGKVQAAASAQANQAASTDPSEFDKEAIASIREITLQLLLLAVGVFALVGNSVGNKDSAFKVRPLAWLAFILLGGSVVSGLLTYGNLIHMLGASAFTAKGDIAMLAAWQWGFFGSGGLVFMVFVLLNLRKG
jgi:hypothetical protein